MTTKQTSPNVQSSRDTLLVRAIRIGHYSVKRTCAFDSYFFIDDKKIENNKFIPLADGSIFGTPSVDSMTMALRYTELMDKAKVKNSTMQSRVEFPPKVIGDGCPLHNSGQL